MYIGVVGLGTMGKDIATLCSKSGHKVLLFDKNSEKIDYTKNYISRNIKMSGPKKVSVKNEIEGAKSLKDFDCCDIIIESISENIEEKIAFHRNLSRLIPKNIIVFVNTSSIPIHIITQCIEPKNPYIGVHFMNPVSKINTFEIIDGEGIYKNELLGNIKDKIIDFFKSINKKYIFSPDTPGFISNRISHLMINEASLIMEESDLSAENIDQIFVQCFGHTMGPLATADLIGIDVVQDTLNVIKNLTGDNKYKPSDKIRQLVREKKLGFKEGKGFYDYF